MWISKKKWKTLEKRIADLERKVQSQQELFKLHINNHEQSVSELKSIVDSLKRSITV